MDMRKDLFRNFKIILSPRKMLDVTILTWPGDISPITQNSDIMDLICPSFQILDVTILNLVGPEDGHSDHFSWT